MAVDHPISHFFSLCCYIKKKKYSLEQHLGRAALDVDKCLPAWLVENISVLLSTSSVFKVFIFFFLCCLVCSLIFTRIFLSIMLVH